MLGNEILLGGEALNVYLLRCVYHCKGGGQKNYPFSSLLLLRGPAPPPLVIPWAIYMLGLYFEVAAMPLISLISLN